MLAASPIYAAFPRWRIRDDGVEVPAAALAESERAFAESVAAGNATPSFRLWHCGRALAVTRRDAALPRFDAAARDLAAAGWPCTIRESGGGAVPLGPESPILSLAVPVADPPAFSIPEIYRALCAPIAVALAGLGIETRFGAAPDSFCDGRFNLLAADGRKIAGTAQTWRISRESGRRYALAHAVFFAAGDMASATAAVNWFYELAGAPRRLDPAAVVTLAGITGTPVDKTVFRGHLRDAIGRILEADSAFVAPAA